jgi:hypothetical protein
MSEEKKNPEAQVELDEDELVPEDDSIIGSALRWSLIVLVGAGAIVAVVLWALNRPEEAAPEQSIESTAPTAVEADASAPVVAFRNVTAQAGVAFSHFNGAEGDKLLPETMGSGAAFFDYDNDDDLDLLLVNSSAWPHSQPASPAPTSALYRNDGSGNFEDVSREAGLALELYGTGVAVGDYDGDGWRDVYVAAVGENRLLRNENGRFTDVTARAGVAGSPEEWSSSSAFVDYDGDGDLDLFVCNYVRWSKEIDLELDYRLTGVGRAYGPPLNYQGTFPYLFRNEGDGTFVDVSAESGVQVLNPASGVPVAKALAVAPIDLDGDGFIDLMVANDTVRNFLFHNQGDGTFAEVGELWGLAYGRSGEATGAMGVDAGHYRNDGDVGFAIGNFANEMTSLYISQGDPTFYADEAIGEGIGAPSRLMLSFGVLLFDYDVDGRLDLLQVNGHLESEINTVDPSQTYEQPSQLFWNAGPDHRQGFIPVDLATAGDLGTAIVGRGSAAGDIDGDGDLDVVLTQTGRDALLLRNDQETGHHWLRVRLAQEGPNRDAIGAWIELEVGGERQRRQVMPTRGYQSQSELAVHFGLGEASAIDSLEITWPDGTAQSVEPPGVDQLVVLERQ